MDKAIFIAVNWETALGDFIGIYVAASSADEVKSLINPELLIDIKEIEETLIPAADAEFFLPYQAEAMNKALGRRCKPPVIESSSLYRVPMLVLNVPEWFQDPEFMSWLNSEKTTVFTWHKKGSEPTEYSDVALTIDPTLSGEGGESDMPFYIWEQVINCCRQNLKNYNGLGDPHVIVRLTNLN
jgi:hypothetical protein